MFNKDFIKNNKIMIIILVIIFIILCWYIYQNNKKEHLRSSSGTNIGGLLSACCLSFCPCVISLLLIFYISKKGAQAGSKDIVVSIQPSSTDNINSK